VSLPLIHAPLTARSVTTVLLVLALLLLAMALLSLSVGSVPIPLTRVIAALTGTGEPNPADHIIVVDIRLPRVLLALLVGAGLSVAGVALQALLRNPLAEPYILGISSGGTAGAILAAGTALGAGLLTTPLASFAGSLLVTVLVYLLARRRGQLDSYTLLLSGVMVGAFFNAVVLLIVAVFNQEMRHAFLWLMGNLSGATAGSLLIVCPGVLVAVLLLFLHARNFNLIATGDESALQLGVDVTRVKRGTYLLASLITGLVVSVSGIIGFVGLIIPHICRLLFGPDHRLLLPASFLAGGIFLIGADIIARTVIAPTEIPVGAVTAAVGAPLFIYLLKRS
jgi:iron complex transport system permease protein